MPKDPRAHLLESLFNLHRMSNALVDDSDSLLREAFGEFIADLAKLDPTAVQLRYRRDRIARLLKRAEEILAPTWDEWVRQQRQALAGIGAHQAERATLHLRAVLGAGNAGKVASTTGLSANFFKRIIDAEPFQGAVLKDWAAEQKRKTVFRVGQQVKLGVANGETLDQIIRRVRGRSAGRRGQYVGGVLETTTREASAIVRTAVSEVATHATFGTYEANDSLLDGYTLVVTFDGRTSPICLKWGLTPDKVYPTQGGPRPPFHFQCRTATAPAVNWRSLGLEPPPDGTRATATGQVAADTDFDAWLRSAPDQYARDLLGPTRARLFKEGRVDLRTLLKTDQGRVRLAPVAELAV
jgi:hypothetical protein